jgi:hypothetical protein
MHVLTQNAPDTACVSTHGIQHDAATVAAAAASEGALAACADKGGAGRLLVCSTSGDVYAYASEERDAVVAAVVEGAAAHGVHVMVCCEHMGQDWRVGGIGADGDREYEDALIERLSESPGRCCVCVCGGGGGVHM